MSFGEAVKTVLTKKYADFSGRATRSEYWFFQLFFILCALAFLVPILVPVLTTSPYEEPSDTTTAFALAAIIVFFVFALAMFIPGIAVAVRRLHDAGFSGWWYLITFVPYVGAFVLLILCCLDSKPANKWGFNPKDTGDGSTPIGYYGGPPPAGWYADPGHSARLRWWDGNGWTEHVYD